MDILEAGKVGEGRSVPEPMGLLLRRYARGTFPWGRVKALGLDFLGALQRGRAGRDSMEAPRRKRNAARQSLLDSNTGLPSAFSAPPVAEPSEQIGSGWKTRAGLL